MRLARRGMLVAAMAMGSLSAQSPLVSTGTVNGNGQPQTYVIHHLPINSFPELPTSIAAVLAARGCTIPQSYEARRPENVIHGSFERPGSSDWAVLCTANGVVALMIFFESAPNKPFIADPADDTAHLSPRSGTSELGFNWAIDTAPSDRVRQAQRAQSHSAQADHDAIADTTIEKQVIYRYFDGGIWLHIPLPD